MESLRQEGGLVILVDLHKGRPWDVWEGWAEGWSATVGLTEDDEDKKGVARILSVAGMGRIIWVI